VLTCGGTVTERLPIAPAIPCPATYISAIIGVRSGLFVPQSQSQSQANACRGSSKKR